MLLVQKRTMSLIHCLILGWLYDAIGLHLWELLLSKSRVLPGTATSIWEKKNLLANFRCIRPKGKVFSLLNTGPLTESGSPPGSSGRLVESFPASCCTGYTTRTQPKDLHNSPHMASIIYISCHIFHTTFTPPSGLVLICLGMHLFNALPPSENQSPDSRVAPKLLIRF